ncbi:alpha/beta hydrolase [Alsobacter metallidurans]|uniref:Alpha/beta hydrolase n=1 Tax=Alsobacter metallidurans TaxID=340221 RepID=A0A917IAZ0_9HYPH|nr:alpha/beta hydrolase [Alsobacter metallidurans]GGH30180.1 alpha/beta hydrolase [Alsobacter metallidurans]
MNFFAKTLALTAGVALTSAAASAVLAGYIDRRYPPRGKLVRVPGATVHLVDRGPHDGAGTVLLLHGASANSGDMMMALGDRLSERYRVIAVDRPGHGWTTRPGGRAEASPARQADVIRAALRNIGVDRAVVVGHSWSGALATAFALDHKDLVSGLVLVAGVTHPWMGGVAWYNSAAAGGRFAPAFNYSIATPVTALALDAGIKGVFSPNTPPPEYAERTAVRLLLRPAEFQANAEDLLDLHAHVEAQAPRYGEITVPTSVLHGEADKIVSPVIHAVAISRQIAGSKLFLLPGVGHMPHHVETERVLGEIDRVADEARRALQAAE